MNSSDQPTRPRPEIRCADCGEVMRAEWQPGSSGRKGYWQVTCDSSAKDCTLAYYTLSADRYPPPNLSAYRRRGRERQIRLMALGIW